jgi:hypothetical protein
VGLTLLGCLGSTKIYANLLVSGAGRCLAIGPPNLEAICYTTRDFVSDQGQPVMGQTHGKAKLRVTALAFLTVTINCLPLLMKRQTGLGHIENLDHYYQDSVIAGPGAFIVPVREARHFAS